MRRPVRWLPPLLWMLALGCWLASPLSACWGPDWYTVHFNEERPDFFKMPQPWAGSPGDHRALGNSPRWPGSPEAPPQSSDDPEMDAMVRVMRLKRSAREAEEAGQVNKALALWKTLTRLDESEEFRSLPDRIRALEEWRGPRDTRSLQRYLQARDDVDRHWFDRVEPLLRRLRDEPYRSRAEYLRGAMLFWQGDDAKAAKRFEALARRRPGEALAWYMVGRSRAGMADLLKAASAYLRCAAVDPHGSLGQDAVGGAGRCYFRMHDYASALVQYCHELEAEPNDKDVSSAWVSARMCLRRMTLADHQRFQQIALHDPAAATYIDLHLHYGSLGLKSALRLGEFAVAVLRARPTAPISGRMLLQLATLEERLKRLARAEELVQRAFPRCAPGVYQDQARWQRARIRKALHRPLEALLDYEYLSDHAVAPQMRSGAHEAAALLSERTGDYPNAVRHYFALEYRLDYGYLVDALASPDDLRTFLRRWPTHPRAKLVRYSLGFRHLRAGRYREAERTFAALGPWLDFAEKTYVRQTSHEKPVWPPLRAARFLAEHAEQEANAKSDSEKARIAYDAAQLIFHQRHLLFYNGALWKGDRTRAFDLDGGPKPMGDGKDLPAAERRALDRYQEEHATLYQALTRFERIAKQYPRTPYAPKALYSAALCYTFLPHVEAYWDKKDSGRCQARAIALYRRIQRDYPDDPLAPMAARYGGPSNPLFRGVP